MRGKLILCISNSSTRVNIWPIKLLLPQVAVAAVFSKAVVLLLFIHCLFSSRCVWGLVLGPCFRFCCALYPFLVCNHLVWDQRAGFTFVVSKLCRYYHSLALPRSTVG